MKPHLLLQARIETTAHQNIRSKDVKDPKDAKDIKDTKEELNRRFSSLWSLQSFMSLKLRQRFS
jgi:hypothetical protein